MRRWVWGMVLLAAMVATGCNAKRDAAPAVEGGLAPDFTLNDLSGRPVKLSSFRGKVVLVNFWGTFCPPCREEIPSLVRLNQSMRGKPFQLLAIAIDKEGKEIVDDFFKKTGVTMPALIDADGEVAGRYGTSMVPETFIVDTKGVIMKKVVGAMDWSSPQVMAALDDLMKGK
jgi:peroxiredoxin